MGSGNKMWTELLYYGKK